MGEKKNYTCKNPSCKTTFTTPLKTLNLQENPTEPYYACPFCLTKIEDPTLRIQEKPAFSKEAQVEIQIQSKQKPAKSGEKLGCQFHLGYLSERKHKEQVPEGCFVCKDIVECMLKSMREET